jgi:protein TonB
MIVASLALHGAAFAAVARARPAPASARERIEIEVVRKAPAAPAAPPAPAKEKPVRVARAMPAAPAPRPEAPPPPALASAPPPAPGAPAPRAIPRIGLSLGSTVASGAFAVGVGNTAYGKADEIAADPSSVRPYSGGVVPAARLSAQPRILELPKIQYPPQARRDGLEGQVTLVLRVDARGAVTAVRVVDAPSAELGAAAAEGARRFRFSPALLAGEPVETEIRFTYTFLLE